MATHDLMNEVFGVTAPAPEPEPLTLDKLRDAMTKAGLPRTIGIGEGTDLKARLSTKDNLAMLGEKMTRSPDDPTLSIYGMRIETDQRIPKDVMVIRAAGEIVKVIALTEDAHQVAENLARVLEHVRQEVNRATGIRDDYNPNPTKDTTHDI